MIGVWCLQYENNPFTITVALCMNVADIHVNEGNCHLVSRSCIGSVLCLSAVVFRGLEFHLLLRDEDAIMYAQCFEL